MTLMFLLVRHHLLVRQIRLDFHQDASSPLVPLSPHPSPAKVDPNFEPGRESFFW